MTRHFGNGDPKRKIIAEERDAGYVVFSPESLLDVPDQFSANLSMAFSTWLSEHPAARVRAALPISDKSGQTIILHVWYDTENL